MYLALQLRSSGRCELQKDFRETSVVPFPNRCVFANNVVPPTSRVRMRRTTVVGQDSLRPKKKRTAGTFFNYLQKHGTRSLSLCSTQFSTADTKGTRLAHQQHNIKYYAEVDDTRPQLL